MRIGLSTGSGVALTSPQTIAADGWRIYDAFSGDVTGDGRDDLIWSSTCQELGLSDCIGADGNRFSWPGTARDGSRKHRRKALALLGQLLAEIGEVRAPPDAVAHAGPRRATSHPGGRILS